MSNKKENLNEHIQLLEELVRKAYQLISPIPFSYDLEWLMKQNNRNALFEKNPGCFLKLRRMGREIPFFPICNRNGMIDPQLIDLSLKLVDKLSGNDIFDQNHLLIIASKLRSLRKKYSNEIPKPTEVASKKSLVTRFINNVAKTRRNND